MSHEIITRRNLPHWYMPGAAHSVTFRLAGTIPASVLRSWREERDAEIKKGESSRTNLPQVRQQSHKRFFAKYDQYLDGHCEIAWLQEPRVAAMVRRALYYHDTTMYHLLSHSIIPNHVHVLLHPIDNPTTQPETWLSDERADSTSPLSRIMHSLKSYTANKANKMLQRSGQFWQHESYDHWVRDDELERVAEYIDYNAVKAGLVRQAHEWCFCSAHDRFVDDGSLHGLLKCLT